MRWLLQAKAPKWRLLQIEPPAPGDGVITVAPADFSAADVQWVATHETALRTLFKP